MKKQIVICGRRALVDKDQEKLLGKKQKLIKAILFLSDSPSLNEEELATKTKQLSNVNRKLRKNVIFL